MKKGGIENIGLEQLFEQIPGNVYWKDKKGVRHGCNASNLKCFGIEAVEDYVGKSNYDVFPKEEADIMSALEQKVVERNEVLATEEWSTVRTGEQRLFLSYKAPLKDGLDETVGILGVSLDITEAKAAEIKRLDLLENILDLMPAHVYWKDLDGGYLDCNDLQAKSLGLQSRSEIRNTRPYEKLLPEERERLLEHDRQVLEQGVTITVEEPGVRSHGGKGWFLTKKTPLYDKENNIAGLLGISFDITERRKQELEIEKAKAQAYQMAKQVTHDLNNFVFGLNACIKNDATISPQTKEKINDFLADMDAMSGRLLAEYRSSEKLMRQKFVGEAAVEVVSIAEVLQRAAVIAGFKCMASKLTLDVQLDETVYPLFVEGNSIELKRIILNLINNAIEAEPKSKLIQVTVAGRAEHLLLTVKDDGMGIPSEVFAQLGLVEVTYGKEAGHGIGIFHAARKLVAWGGNLSFQSTVGVGTSAVVNMPLIKPPKWFVEKIRTPGCVVIVDDNQAIHDEWLQRFSSLSEPPELVDLYSPKDFSRWLSQNKASGCLFLVDQQYVDSVETGIELIVSNQLQEQAVLVTAVSTSDGQLVAECELNNIKLLSKSNLSIVPLCL
jgi:PAS domain S-box-containing protein